MRLNIFLKQYAKMAVQNILLPCVYRIQKPKRIQKGLVIFADAHNSKVPPSMEMLVAEIKKRGKMQVMEIYDDYQRISFLHLLKRMLYFMKYYARAEYVVICDNFLPVSSCKKRKETTVIQLWHGCGAFKKFGYDTTGDIPAFYRGNVYKNYDLVTVSAPACVPHFQSAMRLNREVFQPIGVCRTDKFFQEKYQKHCRAVFCEKHPDAVGKKTVLWAPTFRGSPADPKLAQYADIMRLSEKLGENVFVIIKVHPHLKKKYPYDNSEMTTDQLLPVVDLLVTDYSSIIFEYCIYKKPMLFYAPDMEEYGVERGFYLDYRKLPGKIVTDEGQLAEEVERVLANGADEAKRADRFYRTYMSGCDGHVTQRLADRLEAGR